VSIADGAAYSRPVLRRVHHLNVLVRDLEAASARYAALFGLEFGPREALAARGVVTRRARIGETWLVLVEPTRADSVPGRRLAERGEGLFLVSFEVDDVDAALHALAARDVMAEGAGPRVGLEGWRVVDLDPAAVCGVSLQLCEERHDRGTPS
jgi:methylmalonyl-CoA/ethylmalonyl-CoA epimerase